MNMDPENYTEKAMGGGMPPELAAADAAAAEGVLEDVGNEAPVAEQPFMPESIPLLANAMNTALKVLSDGQIPPLPEPEAIEGATQVPPELYAAATALVGGLDQVVAAGVEEAGRYAEALDPDLQLASDQGIREFVGVLADMETDQAFVEALQTTPAPAGPPDEADTDTDTDTDADADLDGLI